MSFTYWFAKRFGVLAVLLYLGAAVVLVVSHYRTGMADTSILAGYYPPGRAYPRTTKNRLVREIFGLPFDEDEIASATETVEIVNYTEEGAVVKLQGKAQKEVPTDKVVQYLVNSDTGEIERALEPFDRPLDFLLDLHLRFMKRVETGVGGEDADGLRRLILPKVVIAVVYLGLVFILYFILRRIDRTSDYKCGFSITYGALIFWPISVIAISLLGTNVVDVVRHLPGSYHFMRSYILGSWAVIFAWPLLVIALGLVDVIRSGMKVQLNHFLAHSAVLAIGIVSIPLVTVGALFAILVCVLYAGYRVARKVVLPNSL